MADLANNVLQREIIAAMEPIKQSCFDLADEIWGYAELGYDEHRSAEAQAKLLEENGFKVTRGVGGITTAFMAEAGEGPEVVAFLGEYDALDGLSQDAGVSRPLSATPGSTGHGCGHNLLGSASLLAAWAAVTVMKEKGVRGRVRYYGCPAEESGSGKAFMVKVGCFENVDFAFSWHPTDINGLMHVRMLSAVTAKFRFYGRTAHAGVSPETGRSALDAAELMSVGVNYMREHMPSDYRIHFAYSDAGGSSPNVVAGFAEATYLIRAVDNPSAKALFKRVSHVAEGAALMTETRCEIEIDAAASNLLSNVPLAARMIAHMEAFGPPAFDEADHEFAAAIRSTISEETFRSSVAAKYGLPPSTVLCDRIIPMLPIEPLSHGSTDVGDVSWVVPTMQCTTACFAAGTPFHTWQIVAQGKSSAAHKGMLLAAQCMAATAIDVLTDPALAEAVRADFQHRIGSGYESLIPSDVVPPPQRKTAEYRYAA